MKSASISLLSLALTTITLASHLYDFGNSAPAPTYTQITSLESPTSGYTTIQSGPSKITPNAVQIRDHIIFSTDLPEGNYRVALTFAPSSTSSPVTVKSECRRLVLHDVLPSEENNYTLSFTANVKTALLKSGDTVKLKDRELGLWRWDDKLQVEIYANSFELDKVEITPIDSTPTLFLLGDSTVTDQPGEPWIGWGQMLPLFFTDQIVISNHATSGLAYSSFKSQKRLEKVLESMKPGDFALLQFGHNDQKEKGRGIGPWESYTQLTHEFVQAIRAKGAHPVLVTSMKRRRFDAHGRQYETLGDYPQATRQAARDLNVPLIDLNHMSGVLYSALGPEDSKKAFVHYPANTFPDQAKALKDDTHFNAYGGHELALCVVEAIKTYAPELATYLHPDLPNYDPSTPTPFESLNIPASPISSITKPDGN